MESITLDSFINERIEENKELFTMEELQFIKMNQKCVNKIYVLGARNYRDCYINNLKR
ncbi:MAG: hypothetical protein HFJ34_08285 [Clostridia bacterium]|nr:hypothetical protein [Clostridia bacterium]